MLFRAPGARLVTSAGREGPQASASGSDQGNWRESRDRRPLGMVRRLAPAAL